MATLFRTRSWRGIDTIQIEGDKFYLYHPQHPDHPKSTSGGAVGLAIQLKEVLPYQGCDVDYVPALHRSGDYHPRLWRGTESPTPEEAGVVEQWISAVRIARTLFDRLRHLFGCMDPDRRNDPTYGLEQRNLLILACTEVESAWKSILYANGYGPALAGEHLKTNDYVRLLGPLRLSEWSVLLSAHPEYGEIKPYHAWDLTKPTKSLTWYAAYNAVKHDRETKLPEATFGRVVEAMAAVFIITVAQFGVKHLFDTTPFQSDVFRISKYPAWSLQEAYIRPLRDQFGEGWLGHDKWTPVKCSI